MLHRRAALSVAASALAATALPLASPAAAPLPRSSTPRNLGLAPDRLRRIGAWLQAEVDAGRIPGAVVAIGRRGQLGYLEAVGFRDREANARMPLDGVFRIASMTKPIASVALMQLVEQGKVMLWHPVSRYLPEFGTAVVGQDRAPLQRPPHVLDLLRHTSGLTYGALPVAGGGPVHPIPAAYTAARVGRPDQTAAEFITALAAQPLMFQPGTTWEYSHATDVVGRIVEVVSGKDLDTYVRENISAPLGLRDTGFWAPPSAASRAARPQVDPATGRKQAVPDPLQRPQWFSGGGGMVSTAADYAVFCQMLLNGGRYGGAQILGRKTVELMMTDQLPPGTQYGPGLLDRFGGLAPSPEVGNGFGLGFAVRTARGSAVPGSIGDCFWGGAYGTYFWVDPAEQLFAVLMLQGPSDRLQYRYALRALTYQALA